MRKMIRKKIAVITAVTLAVGSMPTQFVQAESISDAATKGYTISKGSGTYSTVIQTRVTVKKGYKVYFTKNGIFKLSKVIKSGKTKTFTIKKDSGLQLIAVKKSKKVTKAQLNSARFSSKIKTYTYDIEDGGNTSGGDTNSSTSNPSASQAPGSSAVPTATVNPKATPSAKPTASASAKPTANASTQPTGSGSTTVTGLTAIKADTTKPAALTYTESSATSITIKAAANYATAETGTGYTIAADGSTSVLTISSAGTYVVKTDGSSAITGRIEIAKGIGAVTLVLAGVNLTSDVKGDSAVIDCKKSNDLSVIIKSGTTNTLTSTGVGEADEDDPTDTDYPSGILAGKGSTLKIGGTGTLNINSTNGSGIKVKYNEAGTNKEIDTTCPSDANFWATTLTIQDNPTINITCNSADETAYSANNHNTDSYEAHQDAISTKNSLAIYGGKITIAAGDDGIHAEATSHIVDGTITVKSSTEGLEGARVVIDGGTIELNTYDDGINAANGDITTNTQTGEDVNIFNITINAGTVTVNCEGDGIDSNGNAFIVGGTVAVYGPSSGGNGALDVADRTGTLLVSGGTLTATAGTSDMAVTPSTGGLGFVAFTATSTISAGTTLKITDSSGKQVGTVTTKKSTKWILYSSSGITNGSSYNLVNGSSTVATATAGQGSAGGMGGGMTPPNGSTGGPGGMTPPNGSTGGPGGMTPPNFNG